MNRKTFGGAIGVFAILWAVACIYFAAMQPEAEQVRRLAWLLGVLTFALVARWAFGWAVRK